MNLVTERLVLRPWEESDAGQLYELARDPAVGPAAGWTPHTSVEDSLKIIREILRAPGTDAVVQKESGKVIGSCGIFGTGAAGAEGELERELFATQHRNAGKRREILKVRRGKQFIQRGKKTGLYHQYDLLIMLGSVLTAF